VLGRARAEGLPVIVVTGRMVQALDRVMAPVGHTGPAVCYQGAVVVDADGRWLEHIPLDLELARETITALAKEGYEPNVYIDDRLYVSRMTPWVERYAGFQQIPVEAVGDLATWLDRPPTKLVCVGEEAAIDELEVTMKARLGDRMYITQSLPHFLEFATLGVTKASGIAFLAERLGFSAERTVAFGDGENDVELIEWAGYGIAVENAHPRVKAVADWVCPPAEVEGVAKVIEALLDSRL